MFQWLKSSKFILTLACLAGVFLLAARGIDVRQLEIILPAILCFYNGANVAQDIARRKYGEPNGPDNGFNGPNNSRG